MKLCSSENHYTTTCTCFTTNCGGIRCKLKKDNNLECQTCHTRANKQTNIAEDSQGIELNGQPHEIVEKFCYLCDTIETGGGAIDSAITSIRRRWSKFRDLVPRGLSLVATSRFYIPHVGVVLCYIELRFRQLKRKMLSD